MNYKHPILNAFLALLLCISLLLPAGYIDGATTSARIISITGDVQVMRAGGDKSFKAFVNMRLTEGDRIITGRAARARVEIDSERIITLAENTRIYLSELRGSSSTQQSSIALQSGGVGSSIKSALTSTSRFEIRTPTAVMGVRGTEFFTSYNNGEIDVRVITGAVNVNASLSGGSPTPPGRPSAPAPETEDPAGSPGELQPEAPGQPPAPPTRPVRPPAPPPPPPPPPAPGAPEVPGQPGRTVSFTIEAMQQARFSEHSTPEQLLAPPQPLSLEGLDVAFIDRVQEIALEAPEIIPETIRNTIPAARQQAEERSQQRAEQENIAPDEFEERVTGGISREIIRSVPSTFAPPAPPPPPSEPEPTPSGTSGGDDDFYEEPYTPPPNVEFNIYLHEELVGSSIDFSLSEQHPSMIYLDSLITGITYSNVSSSSTSVAAISMYETNNTYEISINGPGITTIIITGSAEGYAPVTKSFTLIVVIDLSNVSYNVRESTLINTTTNMQYQIADDNWSDAGMEVTDNVSFEPGTVKVRQTNYSSNERLLGTIAAPTVAPTGISKTDETEEGPNNGTLTGVNSTMEYSLANPMNWITIEGTVVTGLAPGTYLVRVSATVTALASQPTSLTIAAFEITSINLEGVNINISNGAITGTTTNMQYSFNSADGTDGTWSDCTDTNTSVTFTHGPVFVRQKDKISNFRLVATIAEPAPAPTVGSTNETAPGANDGTLTGVNDTMEYKLTSATDWTAVSTSVTVVTDLPPETYEVRVAATETALPSLPAVITIDALNDLMEATNLTGGDENTAASLTVTAKSSEAQFTVHYYLNGVAGNSIQVEIVSSSSGGLSLKFVDNKLTIDLGGMPASTQQISDLINNIYEFIAFVDSGSGSFWIP